jgi:hypothetical protein
MKNSMILWGVSGASAVAFAVACSSSSTPATTPPTEAGTDDGTASSSSGGSGSSSGSSTGEASTPCFMGAAACCSSGQVLCGSIMMTTNCQAGPCPATAIGPIQLCASADECFVKGDICAPLAAAPTLPIKTCQPGEGGAPPAEAGTEAGPTEAGPTEAGPTDAAGGG